MPGRGSNSVLPLPLPGGQTSLPTSFPLHGLFVSLLIGVTLCACTSAPENPSQEAVPGRDDSLAWDAFVALQIGEPEGTEEYVFGRISYIDVDQSRRIFVLDALEQKVRVFRPDGTFSFSVGRKGQGPGEFLSARGFGIDPSGRLIVSDPGNDRISWFDKDGEYLGSSPRAVSGVLIPWIGGMLPTGQLLEFGFTRPEEREGADVGSVREYFPVVYDPDQASADTFPHLSFRFEMVGQARLPFSPSLHFLVDPFGFIWTAVSTDRTLEKRTLDGRPVSTIALPKYEPEAVTDQETLDLVREYNGFGYPLGAGDVPREKPTIARVVAADDGKILVFPRESGYPVGSQFDVFSSDGTFISRVHLPVTLLTTPSPVLRNGSLFGVVLGEFDVPIVTRLDFGEH